MKRYLFMGFEFTTARQIARAVMLAVLSLVAVGAYIQRRKQRTLALRDKFGPEYDRAILIHGSARDAEAKLADRENRVDAFVLRELDASERERFVSDWHALQSRFVDFPKMAVTEADDLINALLSASGYPQADFEQRAADISVDYPRVMESYRVAHSIAFRIGRVEASTEELRTAMIQYRDIFDDLLQASKQLEAWTAA